LWRNTIQSLYDAAAKRRNDTVTVEGRNVGTGGFQNVFP
jgi:hypothetical protein